MSDIGDGDPAVAVDVGLGTREWMILLSENIVYQQHDIGNTQLVVIVDIADQFGSILPNFLKLLPNTCQIVIFPRSIWDIEVGILAVREDVLGNIKGIPPVHNHINQTVTSHKGIVLNGYNG